MKFNDLTLWIRSKIRSKLVYGTWKYYIYTVIGFSKYVPKYVGSLRCICVPSKGIGKWREKGGKSNGYLKIIPKDCTFEKIKLTCANNIFDWLLSGTRKNVELNISMNQLTNTGWMNGEKRWWEILQKTELYIKFLVRVPSYWKWLTGLSGNNCSCFHRFFVGS